MHLKAFVKLKKTLKTPLSGQKTQKNPKNPKNPKKPTGLGFFLKKPGFFPTLLTVGLKYVAYSNFIPKITGLQNITICSQHRPPTDFAHYELWHEC
jgi:hypothetical protein